MLGHRLVRQPSRFRNPLPPEKILALGLYRLGHGNSYVTIGPSFNVGKATAIEAVQDVVEALYEIRNEYIKFPETEAETVAATGTLAELSELPNIVGAIDGSHVKIKAPKDSAVDYFSRYQQHDFIIQAVVNETAQGYSLVNCSPAKSFHKSLEMMKESNNLVRP